MGVEFELRERYHELLLRYAQTSAEDALAEASELGKRAVIAGVPHEEVVELHEETLRRIANEHPELSIGEAAIIATEPLMELFMAYGLAFLKQLEDTRKANQALREEMRIREEARRSWPATRRSWPGPTRTWSSSRTSSPTTSRPRCDTSRPSRTSCWTATRRSSTRTVGSASASWPRARSACPG